MNVVKQVYLWSFLAIINAGSCLPVAAALPAPAREALETAFRKACATSGRDAGQVASRKAFEDGISRAFRAHGDEALRASADGGLELIEASIKHGDDLMRFAVNASPAARRVLALKADVLIPLVRTCGPEIIEIEARVPGLAVKAANLWDAETLKTIAAVVPAEDLPRLIRFAELSKTPGSRKMLFRRYAKEGSGVLDRFPYKRIMAGGVMGFAAWLTWSWPPDIPPEIKWGLFFFAFLVFVYFLRRFIRWWPIRRGLGFVAVVIGAIARFLKRNRRSVSASS